MRYVTTSFLLFLLLSSGAFGQECNSTEIHTIQKGDFLYKIALQYGDARFWEPIYIANADRMANPNLIFPGQRIRIPARIAGFRRGSASAEDVLASPFCSGESIPTASVNSIYLVRFSAERLERLARSDDNADDARAGTRPEEVLSALAADSLGEQEKLEAFRKAFNAMVADGEDNTQAKDQPPARADTRREQLVRMEVDGMVLDQTISKMGRDFYDVFYQYWQAPQQAYNFTIKITEQPAPTLGTQVTVFVNETVTFRSRLQPRFDVIEQAGKQAVQMAHNHLKNNDSQFKIY